MNPNPFQYLLPVPPEKFFGRWALVRKIAEDVTSSGGQSHAIIAGRRCGKSSLLMAVAHQLRRPELADSADFRPFPVLFDFKSSALASAEKCLAEIFAEAHRRVDATVRRRPADAWPIPLTFDAAWFLSLTNAPALSLREFVDALGHMLDQMGSALHPVRAVLLLDEMDEPLGQPWTDALFNQLRSLVYASDVKEQVRLVLAGSKRFLDEVNNRGSPLLNVLTPQFLEMFTESDLRSLAGQVPTLPEAVVAEVWRQSGGHPYLAQFLLHSIVEEGEAAAVTPGQIRRHVARFLHEYINDLQGWANGVDKAGLYAYSVLSDAPGWVEEEQIIRAVNDPHLDLKRGLTALCYHGLAIHDDSWGRYRRSGDLFKKWFDANRTTYLRKTEKSPLPTTPEKIIIYANTVDAREGIHIGEIKESSGITIVEGDEASVVSFALP